jgi:hypothetical protein
MPKVRRTGIQILNSEPQGREDGRVFSRFAIDDIPVRFKDLKIGEKGSAVCKDLSGGGAGMESKREIRPRTPLEMWFDLPDGYEPMHLLGKVAWSSQKGASWLLGISFDKPRLMSMSRILKFQSPEEELGE